ncbi:MAG: hypothetical protein ABI614_19840 [Planctomycetota bacterium]
MIAKLTQEQLDALHATGDERLSVVDPTNNRLYVLVDAASLHELERQKTHRAIQAGLESMEAGGGISLAQADAQLRQELGFPPRQ